MILWQYADRSLAAVPEGRNGNRLQVSAGRSTALRYGAAIGSVALALLARVALDSILHDKLPFVTFFAGVVAAAWFGGLKPALLSTALGLVAAEWFFVHDIHAQGTVPPLEFAFAGTYLFVAVSIAIIVEAMRKAQECAISRQIELEREMGERIRAEQALRKAHDDLELRVRQRTTELRTAMEAARESEERLRLAMSAANEAIWEYNPVSGAVRWNETYARNFGRLPETGSSTQWWVEHIHPEDVDRVTTSQNRALAGGGDSWVAEYRLRRADGSWADILDRAVIARDPSGKAVRVVGAMLDITERKQTEESLQKANRKLRQLSADLLRTQDYERRRIARELHDSTAQLLAALTINLSRLQEPGLEPGRRKQVLSEATDLAAACSAEIRTVTYLLHPPLLEEVGLTAALQAYARGFNQRTGIQVEIKIPPDFGRLSSELEATFFRIVQEGLANVHRHSGSQLAVILLERDAREVRLVLQDRGHGLPAALRTEEKGFVRFGVGIMGMRERATQLGGRLELASNGAGARLTVTVPLVQSIT
jgi:PAS domain S-box-containing protein